MSGGALVDNSFQADYRALVQELAGLARGDLDNIRLVRISGDLWEYSGPGPVIEIDLEGRSVKRQLQHLGDWVDLDGLLPLLNALLEAKGSKLRYGVFNPWGGQDTTVVCLEEPQLAYLERFSRKAGPSPAPK